MTLEERSTICARLPWKKQEPRAMPLLTLTVMHWKKYLKTIKLKQNDRCRLVSKRKLLMPDSRKTRQWRAPSWILKRRQGRIQQELKDKIFEEHTPW